MSCKAYCGNTRQRHVRPPRTHPSALYDTEAVIPIEVCLPSPRVLFVSEENNSNSLRANLDLLDERRETAAIRQAAYKSMVEKHYNRRVKGTTYRSGELVLRKNEASRQQSMGKLGPKWEGPYRVVEAGRSGAYILETMEGKSIPRTWNVDNLRRFHF